MKRILIFSTAALAVLSTGCANDDERFFGGDEGRVMLSPEIKSDVKVVSRASATDADLDESLIFWISNAKGPVRKYRGKANLPQEEWLVAGHYIAEAWAGDSVSASFDDRWFKGSAEFDVRGGDVTAVNVPCKIANVLVDISYADGLTDYFSEYGVTVGHGRGSLSFEGEQPRTGYFMMPSSDKNLTWKFEATTNSGAKISREGVIENARPATKYIINIKFDPTGSNTGGSFFDVVVNVEERVVYDDIVLELAPIIKGVGFDLNEELLAKPGEIGRRSLIVSASGELTKVELGMTGFSRILGITSPTGSEFDELNLIGLDQEFEQRLLAAGIQGLYEYDSQNNASLLKINFGDAFTNKLTEGIHRIHISMLDSNNKESSAEFVIHVSNDPLQLNDVNDYDVWATTATISATALREDCGTPKLQYRILGSDGWSIAESTVSGEVYTAKITGLTPGTTYEYRVTSEIDGGFATPVKRFTTEAAAQLQNAGFEEWSVYENKLWMPFAEGATQYWDSGNSALKTMLFIANLTTNPTAKDEDVKHNGLSSARLRSKSTAGVLAAGNIFYGEFLRVEGGTNGVLGWGRSWSNRPQKLKGWAKYQPVAITSENSDYPDLKKGDQDKGIIYIALLDNSISLEDDGKNYPVIIKTYKSNRQLFDKNASNVIAYGEYIFDTATSQDGMAEFEINLKYTRTDVKPSYIMCTASASIGGDYFVGGDGSTLWLDDLELVY